VLLTTFVRRLGRSLLVAAALHSTSSGTDTGERRIEVKLTKLSQRNCAGRFASDGPVMRLKLRLTVTDVSDSKLIVSQGIGKAYYEMIVGRNERELADGRYESTMDPEWEMDEPNADAPPPSAPTTEFRILKPGNSFHVDSEIYLATWREIRVGDHVLQLDLGTWLHRSSAERFSERWKKYGALVFQPVKSDVIGFQVPAATQFVPCR
jgi:hypothetical protein